MSRATRAGATLDDLMREDGKAELIGGRIVAIMPSGFGPGIAAGEIFASLRDYARPPGRGFALPDGVGFTVPELSSGRESFCPDAAYHAGPAPTRRIRFVDGAPAFAVEVRSEHDRGPAAERAMAAKRADYFEAGTLVVWDVDTVDERIDVYRAATPDQPTSYHRGQVAEAEPAAPGWRIGVDDIFG